MTTSAFELLTANEANDLVRLIDHGVGTPAIDSSVRRETMDRLHQLALADDAGVMLDCWIQIEYTTPGDEGVTVDGFEARQVVERMCGDSVNTELQWTRYAEGFHTALTPAFISKVQREGVWVGYDDQYLVTVDSAEMPDPA